MDIEVVYFVGLPKQVVVVAGVVVPIFLLIGSSTLSLSALFNYAILAMSLIPFFIATVPFSMTPSSYFSKRSHLVLKHYYYVMTSAKHYYTYYNNREPSHHQISGICDSEFISLKNLFIDNFHQGREVGSTLTIYFQNKLVVNLTGGRLGFDQTSPLLKENNVVPVFSSSKNIENLAIAILVDRGKLDYNQTIATYWPEFSVNGKENITLAMLMKHQAGILGLHPMASKEIMNDPLLLSQLLAIQKPFWETKLNKQGYHAITRSLYVAELIRKVDGRNMDLFVKEEITKPLGIDFSFNRSSSSSSVISDDEADYEPKIAPCFAPASSLVVYLFLTLHLILPNFLINLVFSNTTRMSTADISRFRSKLLEGLYAKLFKKRNDPFSESFFHVIKGMNKLSSNEKNDPMYWATHAPCGYSNAFSLAKVANLIANGGNFNESSFVISASTIEKAVLPDTKGKVMDEVLGKPFQYTDGGWGIYPLGSVGWGGTGGSLVMWNKDLQIAFAYVPSLHEPLGLRLRANELYNESIRIATRVIKNRN